MGLRFLILSSEGTTAGSFRDLVLEADSVVAGREEQADIVLPDLAVSRRHVAVRAAGSGFQVEDLGSRAGTRLNGRELEPKAPVPLRDGDELSVGPFRLVFAGAKTPGCTEDTRAVAASLARVLLARGQAGQPPYLRVENGPAQGTRYALPADGKLRIGRGRECELVVDDARVSRIHALVSLQEGAVWLADAGSTNGSGVDGRRADGPVRLRDGALIEIGKVRLRLVEPLQRCLDLVAVLDTGKANVHPALLPSLLALLAGAAGFIAALVL